MTGLSLPQIKFERIDGVILRGAAWQLCCQQLGLLAEPVHPCSAINVCELHCNISDTIRAGGEDAARHAMYLATVVCPTSMPSLSSSPWMRGAPQSGFARLMSRMSCRTSCDILGRPPRGLDFQRQ